MLSTLLTLSMISLLYSLDFLPVRLCIFYSVFPPFHDLHMIFVYFYTSLFPTPHPSSQIQFPIIFNSLMQSRPPLSAPPLSLPLPPLVSLIVLFSAEGYSCLQGYENVRKAHSIFSYVNSHFPPEQTHFPECDPPRCTSRFPPSHLSRLPEPNGKIVLLHCLSEI